jgi:3-oxoacyl-(acyl-carrier-protein) synthase
MTRQGGDVAITGMGLVTGLGDSAEEFWRRICDVRAEPKPGLDGPTPQRSKVLKDAAMAALDAAPTRPAERWLVVVAGQAPLRRPSALTGDSLDVAVPFPPPGMPPVSPERLVFMSHACATVGFCLAYARTALRANTADAALIVGATVDTPWERASMEIVRAISPTRARPFDPDRDGTVLGEGAGAIVLERTEDALGRGAGVLARIGGLAYRVGADSMAGIGRGAAMASMSVALDESGLQQVGYVHAHATGTRGGDGEELDALVQVGEDRNWDEVPVSSHKGAVGHLLHASMFPGIAIAASALADGYVPGTCGLRQGYRHAMLDIRQGPEEVPALASVMVNSFGFGGNHVSLVLTP